MIPGFCWDRTMTQYLSYVYCKIIWTNCHVHTVLNLCILYNESFEEKIWSGLKIDGKDNAKKNGLMDFSYPHWSFVYTTFHFVHVTNRRRDHACKAFYQMIRTYLQLKLLTKPTHLLQYSRLVHRCSHVKTGQQGCTTEICRQQSRALGNSKMSLAYRISSKSIFAMFVLILWFFQSKRTQCQHKMSKGKLI